MIYNFSLRGGSQKDFCPQCGQRTFTPYVDFYNVPLSPIVGYCDRRDKCRYHCSPHQFFSDMRRTNGQSNPDIMSYHYSRPHNSPLAKRFFPQTPDFIEKDDFYRSLKKYELNPLVKFLHSKFDASLGIEKVNEVLIKMGIGTSKKFGGSTVFWLIDDAGNIRDGKIMGYNSKTGKRIKQPYPLFTNIHSVLKEKYQGSYKPCFFGSHLAETEESNKLIYLFESEKAAAIMALMLHLINPDFIGIPMATGGCEALSVTDEAMTDPWHRIQVLRDREVILFPDHGKYGEWYEKARRLKGFCSNIWVSSIMEKTLRGFEPECEIEPGDGFDDLIIRYIEQCKNADEICDLFCGAQKKMGNP